MDIAASIQKVTEDIVLMMARNLKKISGEENLCLSGGVALNCVANGKLLEKSGFKKIWVQPASGDSGSSLGAALSYFYNVKKISKRKIKIDSMSSSYLGPEFSDQKIKLYLKKIKSSYTRLNEDELCTTTAKLLSEGKIIGWFQGRMEFGPRALGNRSILGDP